MEVSNYIDLGSTAIKDNIDVRKIALDLAELTPDQQSLYRRGMFDRLNRTLDDKFDTANLPQQMQGGPTRREALKLVFDDDIWFNQFIDYLGDQQSKRGRALQILGGSQTSANLQGIVNFVDNVIPVAADVMSAGTFSGMVGAARRGLIRGSEMGRRESSRRGLSEAMAPMLTETIGADPVSFLSDLQQRRNRSIGEGSLGGAIGGRVPGLLESRRQEQRR
jgi:hypothetical protein